MTENTKTEIPRLTTLSHGAGWACKLGPKDLAEVLRYLPIIQNPNVLVGTETSDDAGIYQLTPEMAIVLTVDYFTPIVDDPYSFGMIAAANSLSDIYAMGGTPITMLNIVGFPKDILPMSILAQIIQGGADKASEAGVQIIGGHSIDDKEPKFGFVAVGIIHPQKIVKNSDAQEGDILILTKPIGTGIISTAIKRQKITQEATQNAIEVMATLNKDAATIMQQVGVNACTDVTGYGLLGHLLEMLRPNQLGAEIYLDQVSLLPEVRKLAEDGFIPGGTRRNLENVVDFIVANDEISAIDKLILCDAQTSGGLLMAVNPEKVSTLEQMLQHKNVPCIHVGKITNTQKIEIKKII